MASSLATLGSCAELRGSLPAAAGRTLERLVINQANQFNSALAKPFISAIVGVITNDVTIQFKIVVGDNTNNGDKPLI